LNCLNSLLKRPFVIKLKANSFSVNVAAAVNTEEVPEETTEHSLERLNIEKEGLIGSEVAKQSLK